MKTSTLKQKAAILGMLQRLSKDPQALVEIYLNYDCDSDAIDNIYEQYVLSFPPLIMPSINILCQPHEHCLQTELSTRDSEPQEGERSNKPRTSAPIEESSKRRASNIEYLSFGTSRQHGHGFDGSVRTSAQAPSVRMSSLRFEITGSLGYRRDHLGPEWRIPCSVIRYRREPT